MHLESLKLPVKAIAVHPGVVSSELVEGWDTIKKRLMITPEQSAQAIMYALTDETVQGGDYIHNVKGKMQLPANDPALQQDKRMAFWKQCNDACSPYLA